MALPFITHGPVKASLMMKNCKPLAKVLSIQDLCCFGKCSLTLALPIISACGVQCCPLPTALLSTHTGGLGQAVKLNNSELLLPIAKHLQQVAPRFDAIYTGYLANPAQALQCANIIDLLQAKQVLVDPAFADNGKLYSGFDETMVAAFIGLLKKADIICPNITEALFLLGKDPTQTTTTLQALQNIAQSLGSLGPSTIILTGCLCELESCVVLYQKSNAQFEILPYKPIAGKFHGTGDGFAACLVACLCREISLQKSVQMAMDFVTQSIEHSIALAEDTRFGLAIEYTLPLLMQAVEDALCQK
ncbi:MAG: pyridoxamine kinase [Eubacteriales bacterium]|nr:pyridoxamine kinase [Eubacteriales bacterium]